MSVSCADDTSCQAVDLRGNVVAFDHGRWGTPQQIDSYYDLPSVSCPVATFCVAVDSVGHALVLHDTTWSAPALVTAPE